MECSAAAKISVIRLLYESCFRLPPAERMKACEAFFWIADELEDQLQLEDKLNDDCLACLQDVKDVADRAFAEPEQWRETEEFERLCGQLQTFAQERF